MRQLPPAVAPLLEGGKITVPPPAKLYPIWVSTANMSQINCNDHENILFSQTSQPYNIIVVFPPLLTKLLGFTLKTIKHGFV